MTLFIIAYYLFYVLSGGFRHYAFDYAFSWAANGQPVVEIPYIITAAESLLMAMAIIMLIMPRVKHLHLVFFVCLQAMDLYFQNRVGYMSCFILPHLFPLFAFLFLHFKHAPESRYSVSYAGMLAVAVGYLVAFVSKAHSGWFDPADAVIQSYVREFTAAYEVPSFAGSLMLEHVGITAWKALDYMVLVFQAAFGLVFFHKRLFLPLSIVACLFHLGIAVTMGIGVVFYIYILFYAMVIFNSSDRTDWQPPISDITLRAMQWVLAVTVGILFIHGGLRPHFFNDMLPVGAYLFIDYLYLAVCLVIFAFSVWQTTGISSGKCRKTH